MIRDEAKQVGVAFGALFVKVFDDEPNMDELTELLGSVVTLVKEGADFVGVPKEDRLKAGMHALSVASVHAADGLLTYSDEAQE